MSDTKQPVGLVEARHFGIRTKRDCTTNVAKTKLLISCAVTALLICALFSQFLAKSGFLIIMLNQVLFSFSTQLSMKLILFINVELSMIVGI